LKTSRREGVQAIVELISMLSSHPEIKSVQALDMNERIIRSKRRTVVANLFEEL
jgi:hypothetical protein